MAVGTATQTVSPWLFGHQRTPVGVHTLTATYSGDLANFPSTSDPITVTVTLANQTIAFGALSNKAWGSCPLP